MFLFLLCPWLVFQRLPVCLQHCGPAEEHGRWMWTRGSPRWAKASPFWANSRAQSQQTGRTSPWFNCESTTSSIFAKVSPCLQGSVPSKWEGSFISLLSHLPEYIIDEIFHPKALHHGKAAISRLQGDNQLPLHNIRRQCPVSKVLYVLLQNISCWLLLEIGDQTGWTK